MPCTSAANPDPVLQVFSEFCARVLWNIELELLKVDVVRKSMNARILFTGPQRLQRRHVIINIRGVQTKATGILQGKKLLYGVQNNPNAIGYPVQGMSTRQRQVKMVNNRWAGRINCRPACNPYWQLMERLTLSFVRQIDPHAKGVRAIRKTCIRMVAVLPGTSRPALANSHPQDRSLPTRNPPIDVNTQDLGNDAEGHRTSTCTFACSLN